MFTFPIHAVVLKTTWNIGLKWYTRYRNTTVVRQSRCACNITNVADPDHFEADPDANFQYDADPNFHSDADPEPNFYYDADSYPDTATQYSILMICKKWPTGPLRLQGLHREPLRLQR